jgi:hypothetical protein
MPCQTEARPLCSAPATVLLDTAAGSRYDAAIVEI